MGLKKLDDACEAALTKHSRPAICLYRPYPPSGEMPGRSKLGGLPYLPADIEWPTGIGYYGSVRREDSGVRESMTFLAQIDCAELPETSEPLPTSGMLFFFTALFGDHSAPSAIDTARVIYVEDVPSGTPKRTPPANLPAIPYPKIRGDAHVSDQPWGAKVYPEWPLIPAMIESYPHVYLLNTRELEKTFDDTINDLRDQMGEERKREFYDLTSDYTGGPIEHIVERVFPRLIAEQLMATLGIENPLCGASIEIDRDPSKTFYGADHADAFPFAANVMSEVAGAVIGFCERQRKSVRARMEREFSNAQNKAASEKPDRLRFRKPKITVPVDPEWFAQSDRIMDTAKAWIDGARLMDRDAVPDKATRLAFRRWIIGLQDAERQALSIREAFAHGMTNVISRSAVHPPLRKRLPDSVLEAHHGMLGWHTARAHQMLGFFQYTQDTRPMDDSMIPLLHLSSDNAVSSMFGDMGEIQFFIDRTALARRDFNAVITQLQGC